MMTSIMRISSLHTASSLMTTEPQESSLEIRPVRPPHSWLFLSVTLSVSQYEYDNQTPLSLCQKVLVPPQ